MKRVLYALLITATVFIARCGPQNGNGSSNCGANVITSRLALAVTKISTTSYRFRLCSNMSNPFPYTVYGGNSVTFGARSPTIQDSFEAGDQFQVDFLSSDTAFAIYQNKDDGGGNTIQTTDPQYVIVEARAFSSLSASQ